MTALDVALAGDWARWYGLDPYLAASAVGPPLRVHAAGEVVLVELPDPPAPAGTAAALAAPGPAALVQPARYQKYGYQTTDHVWPERGLALVVAAAYDHGLSGPPPDTTPRLVRAELFAPCDLATWRDRWGRFGALSPPRFL